MNPSVYYNEIDPYCAKWLANLMDAGLIPRGDIDTRSIEDVIPSELAGYDQCHFFAGLGGWAYALQLAGWGTRPVWTGSCPCQPFSAAGKGAGFADERHLWPSWQHLISQCEPPVIFGEQVAAATQWLGLVCGDLEAMGRAVGFNHIEAASAGAYHRRDRIFFVADTERACDRRQVERGEAERQEAFRSAGGFSGRSDGIAMADTIGTGLAQRERERGILRTLGCQSQGENVADDGSAVGYANIIAGQQRSAVDGWGDQRSGEEIRAGLGRANNSSHWIIGHDNKARRVEPSIRLLADGPSTSMAALRAIEDRAIQEVMEYGKASQTNPNQVLQLVREVIRTKESWQGSAARMRFQLPAPEILLDFLLCIEPACQAEDERSIPKTLQEVQLRIMRSMWLNRGNSCPPCGWESTEQCTEQSSNSVLALSFVLARHAETYQQKAREAHASLNRTGMLRALGNAIDPRPAAALITAYMQARGLIANQQAVAA